MKLCLDTNAYCRMMKGHAPLEKLLESAEALMLSATVIGELHAGFEMGSRRDANRRELSKFLALPGVEAIPITLDIAERYGIIVSQLSSKGTPIPTNDIWIAACALDSGARLLTYDEHFNQVEGLMVLSP